MKELTVVKKRFPKIESNFDEIATELDECIAREKTIVYTDKKEVKKARAEINKEKKAFSDSRIAYKKMLMENITDWENEAKKIEAKYDEWLAIPDEFLKEEEEIRLQERYGLIEYLYRTILGKWCNFIPLKRLFCLDKGEEVHKEWKNASVTEQDISNDLKTTVINLEEGMKAIEGMHLQYEIDVKNEFFKTLSLPKAMQINEELMNLSAMLNVDDDSFPITRKAEITATDTQITELEHFCNSKGIECEWL